ncbi:MAG TPA: hypothetical protein VFR41_07820, partial [Acidimicrobiia bacterium]|nr:hypothetical protein [Acidimicrobiia bacterium]
LEAADVVTNGRAVSYRRNGVVCYRVALTFANTRGQRFVHAALADWARGRTGTVVAPDGFSTCDQGTRAAAPSSARFTELENLLEVRAELTLVVLKDGAPADAARCGARQFVRQPGLVALLLRIGNRTPTPAEAAQLQSGATALTECRVNTEAGLP